MSLVTLGSALRACACVVDSLDTPTHHRNAWEVYKLRKDSQEGFPGERTLFM